MVTLEYEAIGICEFITVIPMFSDDCWTVLSLIWPSSCDKMLEDLHAFVICSAGSNFIKLWYTY